MQLGIIDSNHLKPLNSIVIHAFYFIRNLAQGLVPKVAYFWIFNDQIVVVISSLIVP